MEKKGGLSFISVMNIKMEPRAFEFPRLLRDQREVMPDAPDKNFKMESKQDQPAFRFSVCVYPMSHFGFPLNLVAYRVPGMDLPPGETSNGVVGGGRGTCQKKGFCLEILKVSSHHGAYGGVCGDLVSV